MTTKPRPRIDYTSIDYESLRGALLELARERLPEWTDHSPNDLGVALVELFAAMGDALFYYLDRVAGESYLETAQERRSVVNLLRLIGYELRPPQPAYADLTLLFNKDAAGQVQIPKGAGFATTAKATGAPILFRYLRTPLTLDVGALPLVTVDGKQHRMFAPLPVVQVDLMVTGEILGSSDGGPRQRLPLARKPLIDGTLEITVMQPFQKIWRRVDTLLDSVGTDEHYAVRRDENDVAWIEFGDGVRGKPPARGRNNLLAAYAIGGGVKGNVPARTITDVSPAIPQLERVYNEAPGSGGAASEAIADAVQRAPRQYRSMGRAVTAADFEAHARSFGVAKARARAVGNRVELWVAPAGGGYPNDLLKDDLRAYLDGKRMLTTLLDLRDPVYVPVALAAKVEVEPYFYRTEVRARVKEAIRALWSFDNVDFADTLYVSKVYEAIESIEGVAGVTVTHFGVAGGPNDTGGALKFGYGEIPLSLGLADQDLEITGGKSDVL
ncbi:baseplate J/gp47 family protein [Nannocystis punicea]|uniref:Baseplate J/gp47 family protein n=1 Tax=Nannocystis punicea TaxID=2995304 RepID=A0ABY7GW53_9BACT|nr:baseplate J/gp47 family protein [Nannocystis poenicansa]WAS91044.1 baseplate J/gp47 family protein [Nannocystis poenicansa]